MKNGLPPYGYRRWADGISREVVRRVYVLKPTSLDPLTRLLVPEEGTNGVNGPTHATNAASNEGYISE